MNKNTHVGNSRKNSMIAQAGGLAAAGLISRMIGLLYKSPLNAIIGKEGIGYYYTANTYYAMILLISSYSIPSAISKVIAQKLSKGEYRNAHRIYMTALGYALVVGGIASMVIFFGAAIFMSDVAAPVLQVFAPTVILSGILGVMRGYFQAHRSMAQTSVSQILEQIINAAVSIIASVVMINLFIMNYGPVTDEASETTRSVYGAMGSAMGTGAGVLFSLLFMCLIYGVNRPMFRKRIKRDKTRYIDSYGSILKSIFGVVTPFIISTAVYQLSTSVNVSLFRAAQTDRQVDSTRVFSIYGIFGNAVGISNIPIAFASAMAAAIIPAIVKHLVNREHASAKERIHAAAKTTMVVSMPCAAGLFALAEPVYGFLYRDAQPEVLEMGGRILMMLSVSVIFYALSTLTNSCLQGLGKVTTPIMNASVALLCQTTVLVGLLWFTDLGIYGLAIANLVYSLMMCLLNQWAIWRTIGYRMKVGAIFAKPLFASVFMGGMVWAIYQGIHMLSYSNVISLLAAVLLGGGLYFVMLLLLRGLNEEELRSLPKGYALLALAKRLGLL
jgi:stage V sporulation protein B